MVSHRGVFHCKRRHNFLRSMFHVKHKFTEKILESVSHETFLGKNTLKTAVFDLF